MPRSVGSLQTQHAPNDRRLGKARANPMATGNHPGHRLDSGVFLYLEGGRLDRKGKIKKYSKQISIKNALFTQIF